MRGETTGSNRRSRSRRTGALAVCLATVTLLSFVAPGAVAPAGAAVDEEASVGNLASCTPITGATTITESGCYVLTGDLSPGTVDVPGAGQDRAGIVVQANDVEIHGGGYSLSGTDQLYTTGIYVRPASNVTIVDVGIRNWAAGVHFEEGDDLTLRDSHFSSNLGGNVYVFGSTNVTVVGNDVSGADDPEAGNAVGIWTAGSGVSDVLIEDNDVSGVYDGMELDGSELVVRDNRISNTHLRGIYLKYGGGPYRDVLFENNSISGTGSNGMELFDANRFWVLNNTVSGTLYLNGMDDGLLCNNAVSSVDSTSSTYRQACPGPNVTTSPATRDFGGVTVGGSDDALLTVENDGTEPLNVTAVTVDGPDAAEFAVAPVGPTTVAIGESTTFAVTFQPTSAGAKSANVTVASNDTTNPTVEVPLSGSGLASGGGPAPEISVTPTSHDFGDVTVGGNASASVTVTNLGTAPLSVGTPALTGGTAYAITGGGGASVLSPGGSRTVAVEFAPTSAGAASDTLVLTSNDSDEATLAISLSGTGQSAPSPRGSSATVEGTVVDGAGDPLSGARVTGYGPNGPVSATTDAAGNFSATVDPGFWGLDFEKAGYGTTSEFLAVNASETKRLAVTMHAPGTVSGTVVDGTGAPIQGATVDVWGVDSGGTTTDANGRYGVDVGAGRYTVSVRASGYPTERARDVRLSAGGSTTVDFTLERPGYVSGTVSKEDGSAAANAYVMADDGETAAFGSTNATGGFNLSVAPGSYTVTAFSKSGEGVATAAETIVVDRGETADAGTLQFVTPSILASNVSHVGGTRPDMSNVSVGADVSGGMMLVRLVNDSASGSKGTPSDLTGLGADRTTEFEITLTVDDYDPSALLWGARDVAWTATPNGTTPGATDLTVRTKTVHLAGIDDRTPPILPVGPLQFRSPADVQWPQGANDTADLGWANTVYFVVYDLSNVPPEVSRDLEGMTVVTNAQTFSRPQLVDDTLRVYAAGPHFTTDGAVHDGFYSAFLPAAQLDEWGVTDPETELSAKWAGDPESFTVEETGGGAWIHLDVHYSDGYAEIEPATGGSPGSNPGGSSGSPSSGGSSSSSGGGSDDEVPTTATPTPTVTPAEEPASTRTHPPASTVESPSASDDPTTTDDPERPAPTTTAAPGQPGFGPVDTLAALVALAGLGLWRRR